MDTTATIADDVLCAWASVGRVCQAWHRARAAGFRPGWYDEELANIRRVIDGVPLEHAVAAASALSPRVQWERVIPAGLVPLLRGDRPVGFPGRNVETATRALDVGLGALKGPKTSAFARALLGQDVPVVDVWSARVAGFDPKRLTPKRYRAAERAYRDATLLLAIPGPTPARDLQEVTWVWARARRIPDPENPIQ